MADRVVKVSLIASVGQYVQGMQQAAQATSKAKSEADKATEKHKAFQDSLETVAKHAVIVGGAITAVGVAVLKTGIDYNTLQQRSRAALTTLLGSAKAANDQMDKLDEFARTSPFSKAVFIQAQQQLIGFGMEAKKVIPTLDAIQNAVAATGGSSQQLAEITFVLAQIQAAGKITGQDLMQLGQRGIDAAGLIGSQMGKTGAQIRADITAGALDAGTALDALTAGMEQRFGGAAANVKQTFSGAMDRVTAAWRDFASMLAEPLVGKNGGGALVELLNWTADLMRGFLALPEPVKLTMSAAVGLVGVVSLVGGTAVLAIPKIVAFRVAVETLKTQSPLAAKAIGGLSGAMKAIPYVALAAGISAVGNQLADMALQGIGVQKTVDGLSGSMKKLGTNKTIDDALGLNGAGELRAATSFGWLSDVTNDLQGFMDQVRGLDPTSKLLDGSLRPMRQNLKTLDETLAQMVQSGDTEKAAEAFKYLASKTDGSKDSINRLKGMLPEYTGAVKDAKEATKDASVEQDAAIVSATGYAAAADLAGKSTSDAAKEVAEWIDAVKSADASFIDLKGGYDSLVQANKDTAQATADATKSSKDSWKDFYDGVSISIDKYLKQLEGQVKAQQDWQTNMVKLAGRVSAGTLTELAKLGPEGAPLVAQLVNASDGELARLDGVMKTRADQATGTFATTLSESAPVIQAAAAQLGQGAADRIAGELASGTKTVEQVIKLYGLKVSSYPIRPVVDTSGATAQVNRWISTMSGRKIYVSMVANGGTPGHLGMYANGGILPGAPSRTDNMLIHAASGEFVVNSTATAQHRELLEAINSGTVPAYADGGFVQPQYARHTAYAPQPVSSTAPGRGDVNLNIINPQVRDVIADTREAASMIRTSGLVV